MAKAPTASALAIDTEQLRSLAELLSETGLSEIEVVDGVRRIRLARQIEVASIAAAPLVAPPPATAAPAASAAVVESPAETHPGAVTSPMVGTVYLSSAPGKPAFVSEGTSVKEGDTVLIIEAMKVMNPIAAPRSGTVKRLLVANEQPVEYGEPLLIIE